MKKWNCAFCWLASLGIAWITLNPPAFADAKVESKKLVDHSESADFQNAAKRAAEDLFNATDSQKNATALAFFYDVRANRVLIEVLSSFMHGQSIMSNAYCDVFQLADLPVMYAMTRLWLLEPGMVFPSTGGIGIGLILSAGKSTDYAAKLLGVKEAEVGPGDRHEFAETWRDLLQLAVKKATLDKPLDDLIGAVRDAK